MFAAAQTWSRVFFCIVCVCVCVCVLQDVSGSPWCPVCITGLSLFFIFVNLNVIADGACTNTLWSVSCICVASFMHVSECWFHLLSKSCWRGFWLPAREDKVWFTLLEEILSLNLQQVQIFYNLSNVIFNMCIKPQWPKLLCSLHVGCVFFHTESLHPGWSLCCSGMTRAASLSCKCFQIAADDFRYTS